MKQRVPVSQIMSKELITLTPTQSLTMPNAFSRSTTFATFQ